MKLQLGCFDKPIEGWYNTDVTPHLCIARIPLLVPVLFFLGIIDEQRYRQHREGVFKKIHYLNAAKKFPFDDNSVDAIYSSQMIANFTRSQTLFCLKECYRVLKSDSIIRITTQDLDHWMNHYDPENPDTTLEHFYQPAVEGNKNRIHWMYNGFSLKNILEDAGFKETEECSLGKGRCPDVHILDYRADSIFVEGVKH